MTKRTTKVRQETHRKVCEQVADHLETTEGAEVITSDVPFGDSAFTTDVVAVTTADGKAQSHYVLVDGTADWIIHGRGQEVLAALKYFNSVSIATETLKKRESVSANVEAVIDRLGLGWYQYSRLGSGTVSRVREPTVREFDDTKNSNPKLNSVPMEMHLRLGDFIKFRHGVRRDLSQPVPRSAFSFYVIYDRVSRCGWYEYRPGVYIVGSGSGIWLNGQPDSLDLSAETLMDWIEAFPDPRIFVHRDEGAEDLTAEDGVSIETIRECYEDTETDIAIFDPDMARQDIVELLESHYDGPSQTLEGDSMDLEPLPECLARQESRWLTREQE